MMVAMNEIIRMCFHYCEKNPETINVNGKASCVSL